MKKRTKKTLSVSLQVFLRLIVATILCAILFLSMMAMATSMFYDKETEKVPDSIVTTFQIISQILMLVLYAIFPYHVLWEFGNRDDTNVRYKGQRKDLWRGFRVGTFATIPYAILWLLLLLAKVGVVPHGFDQVYRLSHFPFLPYVNWVMPAGSLAETPVWQLFLLLPILLYLPVVCGVSYRMGHQQFSIREHLIFAKNEQNMGEEI